MEALEQFDEALKNLSPFHAIFMDFIMPNMDGESWMVGDLTCRRLGGREEERGRETERERQRERGKEGERGRERGKEGGIARQTRERKTRARERERVISHKSK